MRGDFVHVPFLRSAMISCKGIPPTLVALFVLLTGCCIARGCTNLEGLLESFGSIDQQLNLTAMALDTSGHVTYAFESTTGRLIRKVLSDTRNDSDGIVSEDWAFLSPSDSSLLGVISLSRGVAPPASSVSATRPGASPTLLATIAGLHCIYGVTIDAAQAVYSTSLYMGGDCFEGDERSGTFDESRFDSPRYLALTRSSTILYVVERTEIRALYYASNNLITLMRMTHETGEGIVGAFLSPDEQMLFLPHSDGSIHQMKVHVSQSYLTDALRMSAVGIGGGGTFAAFAVAALGSGDQVARVVPTAGTTVAGAPCPGDRYLLATRRSLAVAIAGSTPIAHSIPLNVLWSTSATVLCAAVHSDGRSLLVITARDAVEARPGGIEYWLLTSRWAPAVGRSTDLNAASSSTIMPTSASREDTTLSSLPGSLGVTDAEAISIIPATALVGNSTASRVHDAKNRSSATVATAAAVSEPAAAAASTVAAVGSGIFVLSSSIDAYPAAVANDHVNVVLISTIIAGIACGCLLTAGAYMLARRVRWSLLWKNRRLLVTLGPQGDDIILVSRSESDPGSAAAAAAAADGGYDCVVAAADCSKDLAAAVSSTPQQWQQQQP